MADRIETEVWPSRPWRTMRRDRQQPIVVGKALYARCAGCGSWVRLNKPILGDLHFCAEEGDDRGS